MNYILLLQSDTTKVLANKSSIPNFNSIWFWLSLFELIIIITLLFRQKSKKSNLAFSGLGKDAVEVSKSTKIDMENLMNSINESGILYKELSRKCHPDRFINSPQQKLAEEIFQDISRNKRNFEKLSLIKLRAIEELNLKF